MYTCRLSHNTSFVHYRLLHTTTRHSASLSTRVIVVQSCILHRQATQVKAKTPFFTLLHLSHDVTPPIKPHRFASISSISYPRSPPIPPSSLIRGTTRTTYNDVTTNKPHTAPRMLFPSLHFQMKHRVPRSPLTLIPIDQYTPHNFPHNPQIRPLVRPRRYAKPPLDVTGDSWG